ncbi:MAG: hypothetical protein HQK76_10930 [Desulfobacterales bacterium]|nr:hypothetical protein [Desulfobacterales bacterium]
MKKIFVLGLTVLLAVMIAIPASALESKFGGYWRTRAYTYKDLTGEDSGSSDLAQTDTRTRLYYTAILNENLKLVNKFEMDAVFGPSTSYGDIGADGINVEVKNTYADFNIGQVNFKIGAQGGEVARAFLFCDDFSGATITFKSDTFTVPVMWIKRAEGGSGKDANDQDVDYLVISPNLKLNENMTINPFIFIGSSSDYSLINPAVKDFTAYYIGVSADMKMDPASVWFTGIYEGGKMDFQAGGDVKTSAYLVAVGGDMNLGMAGVHGQVFYATGQDDNETDITAFTLPKGASYYWAELMGYGTIDVALSNNTPGDQITNIMAVNVGVSASPMDKLTVGADIWYASLAEGDDKPLGTEIDLSLKYELVQNLNLDVVVAYLLAGDATTEKASNDANPLEVGAQLSLKF